MQNMIFVLYPLFCILLPCMLYVLIQTKGFHQRTNFIHMIWVFIFLYYVYLVLETTGIGTIWEIGLYPGMKLQEEISLYILVFVKCRRSFHKSFEQRMWAVRSGFQLRMCLCSHKPWVIRQLDHLDDAAIR